jgi:hypothetical protein
MNGKSIGHHLTDGFEIDTLAYPRVREESIHGKEGFLRWD